MAAVYERGQAEGAECLSCSISLSRSILDNSQRGSTFEANISSLLLWIRHYSPRVKIHVRKTGESSKYSGI